MIKAAVVADRRWCIIPLVGMLFGWQQVREITTTTVIKMHRKKHVIRNEKKNIYRCENNCKLEEWRAGYR